MPSVRFGIVAVAAACVVGAGMAGAVTNAYIDNQTQYSNQDPTIETRRSDHFRICFGQYNWDGEYVTEQFIQGNLQMFEHLWQRNMVENNMNDMGQSAILTKRDGNYYRVNFNILMTWNDGSGGGAWGGVIDANGFFYSMANAGYCRYDPPSGATPHEVGHAWEGSARGYNNSDSSGAWWECTANWFALQFLNTYPQAGALIDNSMYYPAHGRDYYDSWVIWETAREDARYGMAFVNEVWTNCTAEQQVSEYIIDRMVRVDSSGSPDKANASRDLWGDMAKKCVTWDFERQRWLKSVNNNETSSDPAAAWYWYQRRRTPMVKMPGTNDWFRPERSHMPMEYGFNMIPLTAATGATVGCYFQPQGEPVRQSDWRASLVAVNNNGEARYSCLWNTGLNSMTLSADETKLYLVVIATPKPMKMPASTWSACTSDAGAQFPYAVWFTNAAPKNVVYSAYTGTHTHHPNGGGIIQSGASVDATAYVGTNAMVLNTAQVRGYARIEDYAVVANSAQVRDNAVVSGHAVVQENAQVYGNAKVRDWARVFGYAEVYENAKVIEHANCGEGKASAHTKVFGSAVVKGTSFVYDSATFGGSLIMDGDSANANGTTSVADHGVHFGWSWGLDTARFTGLTDNKYIYAQHAFERDNGVFAMDQYGINHGFLMNGCRIGKDTVAPTRGGKVLPLDGTNQYVELHNSVNDFRETAIMIWAKWTGTNDDQRIWSMGDGVGKIMYLTPKDSATGNLRFSIADGTTNMILDGVAPLSSTAWTHVAVVFSATTNTLYIDGAAVAMSIGATLFPENLNAPLMENANYLGRGNTGDFFQGYLDDFRVYSKALTAAEVAAIYAAAAPSPVTITPDTTAPTPNAATWLASPTGRFDYAITMSATPGYDTNGWVEYYFTCTSGGGHDSGWVSFNKYTDLGLNPGTMYSYTVKMRDRSGNTTAESAAMGATTLTATTPTASFTYGPVGIATGQITMTATKATSHSGLVEYKFDRTGASSGWQSSPKWIETGLTSGDSYAYTVTDRDGRGNTSAASAPVTTQARDLAAPAFPPLAAAHWLMMPYATIDNKISMTAQDASDPSGVQYYFRCTSGGAPDSGWQSSPTYVTPTLTDGVYIFYYQLKDNASPANTSVFVSTCYSGTITRTTGYHGYTIDQLASLPDDYLVSFTGTVLHVNARDYLIQDLATGSNITVKPNKGGGWQNGIDPGATDPSLALKNVLVKGHLYTLAGSRIVTYAAVTNAGLPTTFTISGKVSSTNGAPIAGATIYISDTTNPVANTLVTATTDGLGNYSRGVISGTWHLAAGEAAYNTSTDSTVTVSSGNVPNINFVLVPNATITGRVSKRDDGTAIEGATVYFSRTADASAAPVFTTTTDASGNYAQLVQNGAWYVCAGAPTFFTSADKNVVMAAMDVTSVNMSLKDIVRNIPLTNDLMFAALTESLPAVGSSGAWPLYYPSGQSLVAMNTPTVELMKGSKSVRNVYSDGDGFRQGIYSSPIAVSGVTVIVVVRPTRNTVDNDHNSIVDIFFDRVMLGVKNDSGRIVVNRNGNRNLSAVVMPSGQVAVVSLVIQHSGTYKLWTNGVQALSVTSTSVMTNLVNGVLGTYANGINVGRNNPDNWSTFNGNIGDVFVYKIALSDAERQQLEADLFNKMMAYTITASANTGGSISPSGEVAVDYGGDQTFTFSPDISYFVSNVIVDGVAQGTLASYTFTNVTANNTIAAIFGELAPMPYVHITNDHATVTNAVDSRVIGGTNNAATVGMIRWSNSLGGSGSVPASLTGWQFVVSLAVGSNVVTATGTNILGAARSDSVSIVRLPLPDAFVNITNENVTVTNAVANCILAGTNNIHTVGMITWTNSLGEGGAFPAASTGWTFAVALAVGSNVVTATGTNLIGAASIDAVTIFRLPPPEACVDITNLTGSTIVSTFTTSYVLKGTNNMYTVGSIVWTNTLGGNGAFPAAATGWTFTVNQSTGDNVITVCGTNIFGMPAIRTVSIRRPEPLPFVDITNEDSSVEYMMTSCILGGTNNNLTVGTITWTNSHGGSGGVSASSAGWTFTVPLVIGANVVAARGTNDAGVAHSDSVTITRQPDASGAGTWYYRGGRTPTQISNNWNSAASWTNSTGVGGYPNAAGSVANVPAAVSGDVLLFLNQDIAVDSFNWSGNQLLIYANTRGTPAGTLTVDSGTGTASVWSVNVGYVFSVYPSNLVLNNDLMISNTAGRPCLIDSAVSGAGKLTLWWNPTRAGDEWLIGSSGGVSNSHVGGTALRAANGGSKGYIHARKNGAFGSGNLWLLNTNVTLFLDNIGATDDMIANSATVYLTNVGSGCSRISLASGVSESVGALCTNGVPLIPGTYGATGSGATCLMDEWFGGTGILTVLPEPQALWLVLLVMLRARRFCS